MVTFVFVVAVAACSSSSGDSSSAGDANSGEAASKEIAVNMLMPPSAPLPREGERKQLDQWPACETTNP
jgi:hypothetical protein